MICAAPPPPTTERTALRDDPLTRTRLLVVDDHPAVRAGLRELLAGLPPTEVAATLGLTPAAMEARLRELLGRLEGLPAAPRA